MKVAWIDVFRREDGMPQIYGMNGAEVETYLESRDLREVIEYLEDLQDAGAGSILIAPPEKPRPEIPMIPDDQQDEGPDRPNMGSSLQDYIDKYELGEYNEKRRWVPWAKDYANIRYVWEYPKGLPEGMIVHYTAGRSASGDLSSLRRNGFLCHVLDKNGDLYQPNPLNQAGYHSGTNHHRKLLGLEIVNAGKLTKISDNRYKAWYGAIHSSDEVRYFKGDGKNQHTGYYLKYSPQQEDVLVKYCIWLKWNSPDIFDFDQVIGHDEAYAQAGKRGKTDPGGSLSMTMPEFRQHIKDIWADIMRAKG